MSTEVKTHPFWEEENQINKRTAGGGVRSAEFSGGGGGAALGRRGSAGRGWARAASRTGGTRVGEGGRQPVRLVPEAGRSPTGQQR